MNANQTRQEVLRLYKTLLRTRERIFANDTEALQLTLQKAREEFSRNKHLTNLDEVKKSIKVGWDANEILKRTVIQAKLNERGNYEMKISSEHLND